MPARGWPSRTRPPDRAIVTTFSKLLDPTTGVLQGEARAAGGGDTLLGLMTQAQGFFDRGQSIPPALRAEIVKNIDRLDAGLRSNFDSAYHEHVAGLEDLGIPGSYITGGRSAAPKPEEPAATPEKPKRRNPIADRFRKMK
jgi:hypothetical protein